jgi:hypothetical protein
MIPEFERRRQNHHPAESLAALATAELQRSSYPEIRQVVCEVHDNVLRLRGSVPTYFHKQVAQASLMKRISGSPRIENQLKVSGSSHAYGRTRTEQSSLYRRERCMEWDATRPDVEAEPQEPTFALPVI